MTIGADIISPVDNVRNLGVHMDQHLTMTHHVTAVCAVCNYRLYRLSSIRHYLTTDATKSVVNALVTSRLDYSNSLLVNFPASQILRLQRVQNNAARLITRTRRHDHIPPVLRGLHWLPVPSRIHFKVLVLAYRCVTGLAPTYCPNFYTYKLLMCAYARTMRQHCTNASLRRALVNLHLEQQRLDFGIQCPQTFVFPRR